MQSADAAQEDCPVCYDTLDNAVITPYNKTLGQHVLNDRLLQGGPKNLKTTWGRFFSLRLSLPPPPYQLLNMVCFHPKRVCFFSQI